MGRPKTKEEWKEFLAHNYEGSSFWKHSNPIICGTLMSLAAIDTALLPFRYVYECTQKDSASDDERDLDRLRRQQGMPGSQQYAGYTGRNVRAEKGTGAWQYPSMTPGTVAMQQPSYGDSQGYMPGVRQGTYDNPPSQSRRRSSKAPGSSKHSNHHSSKSRSSKRPAGCAEGAMNPQALFDPSSHLQLPRSTGSKEQIPAPAHAQQVPPIANGVHQPSPNYEQPGSWPNLQQYGVDAQNGASQQDMSQPKVDNTTRPQPWQAPAPAGMPAPAMQPSQPTQVSPGWQQSPNARPETEVRDFAAVPPSAPQSSRGRQSQRSHNSRAKSKRSSRTGSSTAASGSTASGTTPSGTTASVKPSSSSATARAHVKATPDSGISTPGTASWNNVYKIDECDGEFEETDDEEDEDAVSTSSSRSTHHTWLNDVNAHTRLHPPPPPSSVRTQATYRPCEPLGSAYAASIAPDDSASMRGAPNGSSHRASSSMHSANLPGQPSRTTSSRRSQPSKVAQGSAERSQGSQRPGSSTGMRASAGSVPSTVDTADLPSTLHSRSSNGRSSRRSYR